MTQFDTGQAMETFSSREVEILGLLARGYTNQQIAQKLYLSVGTVKWYNKQIYSKLGVHNRTQAGIKARQEGLLDDVVQGVEEQTPVPNQNLPAELTSFIGRERELAEVRGLLKQSRLVTLTGPGGSGKTRLALQVARAVAGYYTDGLAFIDLVSTSDPKFVVNAIAHALGVVEKQDRSLMAQILYALGDSRLLMVLDNFEHVLAAAPVLNDLLTAAPNLTILVTSRAALRLKGEQEYLVPPLLVPLSALSTTLTELMTNESVSLFVQRAQARKASFRLTEENAQDVAAICRRLDGLPLAIELAAARIKLHTPKAMLERLHSRLSLLTDGARDLPDRQRTLRKTIDWSYELLTGAEKRLFARLGVFKGGRSLAAVEAICKTGLELDILGGMGSLLDKSLLYMEDIDEVEPRFFMLETIQDYAQERLNESKEEPVIRNRHLTFYMNLLEEIEPRLWGLDQVKWLEVLKDEHENLMAAAYWSRSARAVPGSQFRLVNSLATYLNFLGYYSEGRVLIQAALETDGRKEPTFERADALRNAGLLAYMQGDYPATRSNIEEALTIYRQLGPEGRRGLADALITLGDMGTEIGDYGWAAEQMLEALQIMAELGNIRGIARANWQLGACNIRTGEFEAAVKYLEEALPPLRQLGERTSISIALSGLAEIAIRQADYSRAMALEEESLALRRELGEKWGIAVSLGNYAWIALCRGDLLEAGSLLTQSMTLRFEIGDVGGFCWCLEKFAEISVNGRLAEPGPDGTAAFERAAVLLGAAAALRSPVGSVIDQIDQEEYEQRLARVKVKLGQELFERCWATGTTMTMSQLLKYTLEG